MATARSAHAARPRLILVDGHRMVVDSLRDALAMSYEVVAVAYCGAELLDLLRTHSADCILLGLQLPDRHGLDLIPEILALQPALRILIVTMFLDRCLADAALVAGAFGFVPKDGTREELRHAIGEVLAGNRHVSPRVPRTSLCTGLAALHPALARLTPRQQAVFRMLGDGMSEGEIARTLRIAPSTVTFHKHSIQKALGLNTRSALVRHAVLVRHSVASGTPSCAAAGPTTTVPHREC